MWLVYLFIYSLNADRKTETENNLILPWQRFHTSRQIRTLWRSSPVWAAWGTNHDAAGHICWPTEQLELASHCWGQPNESQRKMEKEMQWKFTKTIHDEATKTLPVDEPQFEVLHCNLQFVKGYSSIKWWHLSVMLCLFIYLYWYQRGIRLVIQW